jgi:Fis family transcriptional regulator, factor for inversion stimulation protein
METIERINDINDLFFSENEGKVWRLITDSIEKPLLEKLLKFTHGNQLHAARILGINRNTLRVKLKKHGLLGGS